MSRSIGKSLAAAVLSLSCGAVLLDAPVVADDRPAPAGLPATPVAGIRLVRCDNYDDELEVLPVLKPLPPYTARVRQVRERMRTSWQARHERIRSFEMASDFGPGDCVGPKLWLPESHTELWIDGDLRRRVQTSSPPFAKPQFYAYDGTTHRTWDPERSSGLIYYGKPERHTVVGCSPIWLLAVDPLRCTAIDIWSDDAWVLSENSIIGDRHCVKLQFPIRSSDRVDTLWVDPARNNVVPPCTIRANPPPR
jgi:hypothetical protein